MGTSNAQHIEMICTLPYPSIYPRKIHFREDPVLWLANIAVLTERYLEGEERRGLPPSEASA